MPVFGLSPCATVIFFFGLLMWARPPTPKYLLLLPLAWALQATPSNIAMGHDDLMIGTALVLTAVTLAQAIRGHAQRLHAGRPPQSERRLSS